MDIADENGDASGLLDLHFRNDDMSMAPADIGGFIGREPSPADMGRRKGREVPAPNGSVDEIRIRLDERGRINRELHDSTAQLLVALELQLMRLKQICPPGESKLFTDVMGELGTTVADLHEGLRGIGQPENLDPSTFTHQLVTMAEGFAERTGVVVRTEIYDLPTGISPKVAHVLFRVAQEALANASRHAKASEVRLCLSSDPHSVTLRVADDGVGFPHLLSLKHGGRGIANMRTRLAEVRGKLTIHNQEPGAVIEARVGLGA